MKSPAPLLNPLPTPPSRLTRLCLIRHGETDWNAERRLQGHVDIPLNPAGRAQAAATAVALAQQDSARFSAIYSSDLARALHTAEHIAERLDLSVCRREQLRERHYGSLQGLTYEEAQRQHPETYARFKARDPDWAFPGGGESLGGFAQRVRSALEAIASAHPGQCVIIVSHGGALDIAHRLAASKPLEAPRDFVIPNAALNWIAHDGHGWLLQSWGDQSHLQTSRDELANA